MGASVTWPGDGPPCAPADIRDRIDRLIDPRQKLRVRTIWTFSRYFRFRLVAPENSVRNSAYDRQRNLEAVAISQSNLSRSV
jgi:hypothetical protein